MLLSRYSAGKRSKTLENSRSSLVCENIKTVANTALFSFQCTYSKTRFYVSQAVKAGSTPVSCSKNKRPPKGRPFIFRKEEGVEPIQCRCPVDTCSSPARRGRPLDFIDSRILSIPPPKGWLFIVDKAKGHGTGDPAPWPCVL